MLNSLSRIQKSVQFFESYSKKKNELNSSSPIRKKSSILSVILKKVQFCESYSKKKEIWFDFEEDSHQRDARHSSLTDDRRAA